MPVWLYTALCILLVGLGGLMALGTLLSTSHHPHWLVRLWDFPRVQILFVVAFVSIVFWIFCHDDGAWSWAFLGVMGAVLAWQGVWIFCYTPLAPKQVEAAGGSAATRPEALRLVASNVLGTNDQYDRWRDIISEADPDVLIAVEVNEAWLREAIAPLEERYPHRCYEPMDNYYGMALLSKFPFEGKVDVRHLVQDDVPSMRAVVRLPSGHRVVVHSVHPRPPEPLRNQDAAPRDAELVLVARKIRDETLPVVVAGDFNDVAWSHTTRLFQRLSGLLDPRAGRGFYSTFPAGYAYLRYPLDHVFHSHHFRLARLERLAHVGSDHLPILIELDLDADAPKAQDRPAPQGDDKEEAEEKVDRDAEGGPLTALAG